MKINVEIKLPTIQKKLTTVSVWFKGQRKTIFVHLPVIDGKVHCTSEMLEKFGVQPGTCFMVG